MYPPIDENAFIILFVREEAILHLNVFEHGRSVLNATLNNALRN